MGELCARFFAARVAKGGARGGERGVGALASRSYVMPSAVTTGATITSARIGHRNSRGTPTAPAGCCGRCGSWGIGWRRASSAVLSHSGVSSSPQSAGAPPCPSPPCPPRHCPPPPCPSPGATAGAPP
eukprot:3515935-Prymnesium_polylepis.1